MSDLIDFPVRDDLFFLYTQVRAVKNQHGAYRITARREGEQVTAIALFTDRAEAEEFIERQKITDGQIVYFPTPADLALYLEDAQSRGQTHVAFDPGRRVQVFLIEDVLKALVESPQ